MKCVSPFVSGKAAFGCGQCMPCRFNKRREWTHRIMLEALDHEQKSFITLTYSDGTVNSLDPAHIRDWLKRLRRRVEPGRVRYFCVGEYGDQSQRPHYHAALFGYPCCSAGMVVGGACQCRACLGVRETWGRGHVFVGTLEPRSAQYVAGYVTKKMTSKEDARLHGRYPEFARMSLKPGIGADAMWNVASVMMQYKLEDRNVPLALNHGGRELPLGRYLRRKLRRMLGHAEDSDVAELEELENELLAVRQVAWVSSSSVKDVYAALNEGYARALTARSLLKERTKL